MAQSVEALKQRAVGADLSYESTDEQHCYNCQFYDELVEQIGYCNLDKVDMVVGGPWWCKFWAPAEEKK
jgi:hypothetical protein